MSEERWLPVVGYEGLYEVSDQGRVKSLAHTDVRGWRRREKFLRPGATGSGGHLRLYLTKGGVAASYSVHRLVLEAFVGPCPDGMVGCHYDDDPTNNVLSNLRWDTLSENTYDKIRNGHDPNVRKTHCKHGHEYTPENTFTRRGSRECRTCIRNRRAKQRAKEKEI